MSDYATLVTEDRRLCLLRLLSEATGYTANSSILSRLASQMGHRASRDTVDADLAWLAEQGLATVEAVGAVTVATLTRRGNDVATGQARCPGVARPGPGR